MTNLTKEGAKIEDWLIVGRSNNNAEEKAYYDETRAIIAPRTNGFYIDNVRVYNFEDNMIIL